LDSVGQPGKCKCMKRFGGPEGIRTLDLFHAMEARSQLRHRPSECFLRPENTTPAVP
jgi:hypothetical protein